MEFIFIEDRDIETGHGWRDTKHQFFLDDSDGRVYARTIADEEDPEDCVLSSARHPVEFSYAWVCPKAYYEQHKCIQDNIRTYDVVKYCPHFRGVDDMESHFEFRMTPGEMREHLVRQGMVEVRRYLNQAKVRELLAEGERLRKQYEIDAAPMRQITPDDLKTRSR